jgi:nitrogen fixation protein NifU and related proteins
MDLYSEIILDHFKNPKNKGRITKPTKKAEELNALCGDKLKIYLKINKGKVEEAKFDGEGCAISQASADMLTDKIIGLTTAQIKKLTPEHIYKLLGIEISPGRTKCALLSLETIKKAIK